MLSYIIGHSLRKTFAMRSDGNPKLHYFFPEDFSCTSEDFSFRSGKNLLRGKKIYQKDKKACKSAIIFFHGYAAGANAYMREMCYFAARGYLVYCFDATGCMNSEGQGFEDFAHLLMDVDAFFEYLKHDDDLGDKPLFAIGHSWGGTAVKYCLDPKFPVQKCVSLAGMVSCSDTYMKKGHLSNFFLNPMRRYLKRHYGNRAISDFEDIEHACKPFLYVYGDQDKTIPAFDYGQQISQYSQQNPNVFTYLAKHRGHQCYWTEKGCKYFEGLIKAGLTTLEGGPEIVCNYDLLYDDEQVMNVIIDFLNR